MFLHNFGRSAPCFAFKLIHGTNGFFVASSTLIFILRRYCLKLPGAIIAVVFATALSYITNLPIETIQSNFGEIESASNTHFSAISFDQSFKRQVLLILFHDLRRIYIYFPWHKALMTNHLRNIFQPFSL